MSIRKSILLALAAVALGFGSAQAQLPSVNLKNLDGETIDTATLSNDGKPFAISFFATWCKPCNRELDAIHEVYEEWQEETGMKLIAISVDEAQNVSKVRPLVDGHSWDYEVLLDPNSDLKRALGVQMIPHMIVLDANGNIVDQRSGYTDGSEAHVIEVIRGLLNNAD